ncbi:MAG: flagellar hook-length control protein FliK [Candidatus Polarisedimenticolaceae bacterium]|nr:flagellar hook-length control protein FliK [Candidatus Polarisedimenticolaceae bacterium]
MNTKRTAEVTMQIFNMLSEMKASGAASGESGLMAKPGETLSEEGLSAFLEQLELVYSQSAPSVVASLPWSEIQLSEEGELVDQSGSLLPLSQLISGQLLPLQQGDDALPDESVLTQIKMAAAGEQARLSPQLAGQMAAQSSQPQPEKTDLLANLQASRLANGEMSVTPLLPTVAVTALESTGLSSHLAASFSMLPQTAATATQGALTQLPTINHPVGEKMWGQDLSARIQWMVKQEIQSAEVKLNPRGLGPIEIRVSVQNDQANVSFVAHHAVTREAIDAAIPRLREMFGETNMNLVNVDVSDRNSAGFNGADSQNSEEGLNGDSASDATNHLDDLEGDDSVGVRLVSNGILDDYA